MEKRNSHQNYILFMYQGFTDNPCKSWNFICSALLHKYLQRLNNQEDCWIVSKWARRLQSNYCWFSFVRNIAVEKKEKKESKAVDWTYYQGEDQFKEGFQTYQVRHNSLGVRTGDPRIVRILRSHGIILLRNHTKWGLVLDAEKKFLERLFWFKFPISNHCGTAQSSLFKILIYFV